MVNYVLSHTILDGMVDSSGTGVSVGVFDKYATKWAEIDTLTPTITSQTFFKTSNTDSTYANGGQTLLAVINNESGWSSIIGMKSFKIPENPELTLSKLDYGDTVQINFGMNYTKYKGSRTAISLSLLYTHKDPSATTPTATPIAPVNTPTTDPTP